MKRSDLVAGLSGRPFDLLIVGGGIVGAAIAREAALSGLSTALIEQGDFAGGTSSKTSKLIHGGLRYLEHGHLPLVFESLQERRILRKIAPALVGPLPIMLPVFQGDSRPPWKIHAGLTLYGLLSLPKHLLFPQMLSSRRASSLEPHLQSEQLRSAGLYADCKMDDARLCLANILQAIEQGAVCCNYFRLQSFLKTGGDQGKICGAAGEDLATGQSYEIEATAVVNATGPWADHIRRLSQPNAKTRMAPTKGIHLVLPKRIRHGLFIEAKSDRRMLFLLPWGPETMLVGTTESEAQEDPSELKASANEVAYLLEETNRVLVGEKLTEQEVITTFAGARPLLSFSGSSNQASREHRIELDDSGLVSVMGGKYTTHRRMAQETVNFLMKHFGWKKELGQSQKISLIKPAPKETLDLWERIAGKLDPTLLTYLLGRYGEKAERLFGLIEQNPTWAEPVCPHHRLLRAELIYAVQEELACTVTDLLARRTQVAFSPCQGLDFLGEVTEVLERYGGYSPPEIDLQMKDYRTFLTNGIAFRKSA